MKMKTDNLRPEMVQAFKNFGKTDMNYNETYRNLVFMMTAALCKTDLYRIYAYHSEICRLLGLDTTHVLFNGSSGDLSGTVYSTLLSHMCPEEYIVMTYYSPFAEEAQEEMIMLTNLAFVSVLFQRMSGDEEKLLPPFNGKDLNKFVERYESKLREELKKRTNQSS